MIPPKGTFIKQEGLSASHLIINVCIMCLNIWQWYFGLRTGMSIVQPKYTDSGMWDMKILFKTKIQVSWRFFEQLDNWK